MKENIQKLKNVYRKYGFRGFLHKLHAYIKANVFDRISFAVLFRSGYYRKKIRRMLALEYDRIVLWRSSFGHNVPLYQRPQHIADNLAQQGCLVIYEVTTMTDRVKTLKRHSNFLYLFNFNNTLLHFLLMRELEKIQKPKYIQLYSTDWKLSVADIKRYMDAGFGFIYEYIDHISPVLAGTEQLPKNIEEKYRFVMSEPNVYVVVTADLLWNDVVKHRGTRRLAFSSNGVDYPFIRQVDSNYVFEPEFLEICARGKPIVCYYGALASWFDYDLVKKIAATGKYSVVLFGIKYDESYDKNMHGEPDIYFMGPRDYRVLKNYANRADVLVIPFLINDITKSTSPVKIFEYMALHKPIVTTDMLECRKYSSVLIGVDHDDFLQQLEHALELREDAAYLALLDRQARENEWSEKTKAILDMLRAEETASSLLD